MKLDVVLGLQWGDEGKGKIIDVLTPKYDIIARFQGGPNAGHTLELGSIKHVLHLIPSGIFHSEKLNFLGNGMVICPIAFKKEIEGLLQYIPLEELKKRIVIAQQAKIIMPTHRLLDGASESAKGCQKIGTTKQGIGPTYTDHVSRNGLRIGDMLQDGFAMKYSELQNKHCMLMTALGGNFDANTLMAEGNAFLEAVEFMKQFKIVDGPKWINEKLDAEQTVLAEGAQGTLLDIDHGDYPYVTSSNTTIGGVCIGLGVAANRIGKVYGLFKAYCTRVGNGPFPTELGGEKSDIWCQTHKREDEEREYPNASMNDTDEFTQGIALRKKGNEHGATTGRPRRTGWLDLPLLKYACMINGVTDLIISKADVLSDLESIKLCTGYEKNGSPIFRECQSWENMSLIKDFDDLPPSFKVYLMFIEEETETEIKFISTGPDRDQIIIHE